jgi:hypothetical protein
MKTLLFTMALTFVSTAAMAMGLGEPPATAGGPWPALFAQFTPVDGKSLGDWLIIAIAVLVGADRVMSMIRGGRATPPLHQQFADKQAHDKDITEIKDTLQSMKRDFEAWSSAHYDARRRMHSKINHLSTAMAYLAGSIEHKDARTAERLRDLIKQADNEGDDE